MVVVGIIILVVAVATPAIGPMMASNQTSQVMNTLNGVLATAQAAATANGTPCAVRVERAFAKKTININGVPFEVMDKDASGNAKWLDHQQIRFLIFAAYKDVAFRQMAESKVVDLPKNVWLAPDYSLGWNAAALIDTTAGLMYDPNTTTPLTKTQYSRFDNFFIAFQQSGELVRFAHEKNGYADKTQIYASTGTPPEPITPYVGCKDDSARGVVVYDRRKWDAIPADANQGAARWNFLHSDTRPVFINRTTGSIVEEKASQ